MHDLIDARSIKKSLYERIAILKYSYDKRMKINMVSVIKRNYYTLLANSSIKNSLVWRHNIECK